MRALHFGAGNIGRGFIGKILAEAGHEVVFADVVPVLIEGLQQRRTYSVNVVGDDCRTETVTVAGAVFSNKDEIFEEIVKADLLTTAVGPRILERLAPSIAKAILTRRDRGVERPLNIIACENAIRATSGLKSFVVKDLDQDTIEWMHGRIGFVDCAVDRIVPPARHEDPLEVTVEEFSEWVIDSTQIVGQQTVKQPGSVAAHRQAAVDLQKAIRDVKITDNLTAFVERKLMTVNTGHAICAYLGQLYGYQDIRSSINDPKVKKVVEAAMRESGAVLCKRFNMDPLEHEAYIQKILRRYANPYIYDDVLRVGREPIRKLAAEDRLIKPLRGCLEYGLPCDNLVIGVAAALLYQNPEDGQAVRLRGLMEEVGITETLRQISGLCLNESKESIDRVASHVKSLRDLRQDPARAGSQQIASI